MVTRFDCNRSLMRLWESRRTRVWMDWECCWHSIGLVVVVVVVVVVAAVAVENVPAVERRTDETCSAWIGSPVASMDGYRLAVVHWPRDERISYSVAADFH